LSAGADIAAIMPPLAKKRKITGINSAIPIMKKRRETTDEHR
jgi:hypothetical protein